MLRDAKPKVAGLREIALAEFIFLDLEATFQNFFCLGPTDSDMAGDLFIPSDAEGTDSVAGFGRHRSLTGELFENLVN